jgi:hypothetical protein
VGLSDSAGEGERPQPESMSPDRTEAIRTRDRIPA